MATTTFEVQDGPSDEQMQAEAAALEQGEKIAQMQEEDRARKYDQTDQENQDASLIGGKFKSQEDLLKAYNELQKKLGSNDTDEEEEPSEEQEEAPEEVKEEEQPEVIRETVDYMLELQKEYGDNGTLPDEAVERFSQMDPKELIQSYLSYSSQTRAATVQQSEINAIKESVGGDQAYTDMIQWAGENLSDQEISDFNAVTGTGNVAAIRFAVESLSSRYRGSEGYEAPLVTGRKAPSKSSAGYRSHAELARDIADPRYNNDPAFRQDVEDKLSRSKDLL